MGRRGKIKRKGNQEGREQRRASRRIRVEETEKREGNGRAGTGKGGDVLLKTKYLLWREEAEKSRSTN